MQSMVPCAICCPLSMRLAVRGKPMRRISLAERVRFLSFSQYARSWVNKRVGSESFFLRKTCIMYNCDCCVTARSSRDEHVAAEGAVAGRQQQGDECRRRQASLRPRSPAVRADVRRGGVRTQPPAARHEYERT